MPYDDDYINFAQIASARCVVKAKQLQLEEANKQETKEKETFKRSIQALKKSETDPNFGIDYAGCRVTYGQSSVAENVLRTKSINRIKAEGELAQAESALAKIESEHAQRKIEALEAEIKKLQTKKELQIMAIKKLEEEIERIKASNAITSQVVTEALSGVDDDREATIASHAITSQVVTDALHEEGKTPKNKIKRVSFRGLITRGGTRKNKKRSGRHKKRRGKKTRSHRSKRYKHY